MHMTFYKVLNRLSQSSVLFLAMNPFRLLICFMTLWYLSQASENALFYDLEEKQLVEISKFDEKVECRSCISACPAASNSIEELFNEKASLTKNSIFMRDVYSSPTTAREMKVEICEKFFSPSLLWDIGTGTFNVGYEMYYEKGQIDLKCTWYDDYVKVVNGEPSFESKQPTSEDRIKIRREGKKIEFELDNEPQKKLGFYFINVFDYDVLKNGNSRVARYIKDTINDYQHQISTISYCQNYFSGDDTHIIGKNEEEIDDQVQLLTNNPEEGTSKQPENTSNRLIKAQILPMRMFHTMAARLATCMYLNFTFVWENIVSTTLKKIDLYLYALYRSFPVEIILFFGVGGDLQKKQEIDATAREEITSEHHLFNKFPVPEMLLRFVKVMVNLKRYGVVIVIHNNVKSVDDSDRICSVEDEIESWDAIRNTNVETGLSYACAQTQDVFEKLGYNQYILPEIMLPILPLELNNFPFRSDKWMVTDYKSVLDEIDQELSCIKKMHIEY